MLRGEIIFIIASVFAVEVLLLDKSLGVLVRTTFDAKSPVLPVMVLARKSGLRDNKL